MGKKWKQTSKGSEISSDAELVLLREVERQVGLIRRVAEVLRDRRHPGINPNKGRIIQADAIFLKKFATTLVYEKR